MQTQPPVDHREFVTRSVECDLVIVGGGLAGTCCAITAARAGAKVVLIQDRPVLGGNASSEVRMWAVGATSHMGSNNRWAREGGVIDEILVENVYRNPEGNCIIFDALILEKVVGEPNITLLLNTVLMQVNKSAPDTIFSVRAFCSQNSMIYDVRSPLYCDASGDGVVGYLAGAAFRVGAESGAEFGEKLAPSQEYGELLGHTIFFYSKDVGKPVKYTPPSFALRDITKIPRYQNFNTQTTGNHLWWLEYGGRLDTVHDTETIKWELWSIVYGVWDYIKNSGKFPEAETQTLEWVGSIPGKRESRRFEGDYMMNQHDIVEQRQHPDTVSYGGWALDLHPADGIYSEKPGSNMWHPRGVYGIPYRCLYSRNISNLFLAGRIISVSHVAFGSTRVMATLAHTAQAAGMAAAICARRHLLPADLKAAPTIKNLQMKLLRAGQFIPGLRLKDPDNLAQQAHITASSQLNLARLEPNGPLRPLNDAWAQMLPVGVGPVPHVSFKVNVAMPTVLELQLRTSNCPSNFTPDILLASKKIELSAGENQTVIADFSEHTPEPRYVFYCLLKNDQVAVRCTEQRVTGILAVGNKKNLAVLNHGAQAPAEDLGLESFEFWSPQRRPEGQNLAVTIDPPLTCFAPENVANGTARPTSGPNAWVCDFDDQTPTLHLRWDKPQTISCIELGFDTDFDHPMETLNMGHPERSMPFCIKHYRICDGAGRTVSEKTDNFQTLNTIALASPLLTDRLDIELVESHGQVPAALFEVRCYAS